MSNAIAFAPVAQPVTKAVVQNDEITTTPLAFAKPLIKLLSDLETDRKTWEDGAYRTSNQALYAVLAKCLAIAQVDTAELAKQRNAALEAFYKQRGYSYKKDAPPATRVVKAVFGAVDRRRLSTYSLVLREAIKQEILAINLAEWIEQNGGIQEIRLSQSKSFIRPSTKVEIARQGFDTLPVLASVKSEALSLLADSESSGARCVLVAEQSANGDFIVRGFTRSSGALSAAFAGMYADQKKAA
jgi:hypothetical protein